MMPALQEHLLRVRGLNHGDLEAGRGRDYVEAVVRKQASSRRKDHHDLHARAQPKPSPDVQPYGFCVAVRANGLRTREPWVLLAYLYFKPHAGTGFIRKTRALLGVVFRRPKRVQSWFSEPPNKELTVL